MFVALDQRGSALLEGLGDGPQTAAQAVNVGGTIAAAAIKTTGASILGLAPAVAIPLIGVGVMAVTTWIMKNSIRNKQKTASTQIADSAEAKLQENLAGYQAGPHTVSSQAVAAQNAVDILEWVRANCGSPELGSAGDRCISERLVRGGSAPWCPTGTGCDWLTLYLDPILNDADVKPDPSVTAEASAAVSSFLSQNLGIDFNPSLALWAGAALLVAGVLMAGNN